MVTITEITDYPFDENIQFSIQLPAATQFKLYIRVPNWLEKAPILSLNGKVIFNQKTPENGSYLILDRLWSNGDTFSYTTPLPLKTKTWTANKNSVSVYYGPIAYSLDVGEQYERIGGTDDWPEYAVTIKSSWNYGLISSSITEQSVKRKKRNIGAENIFTVENAPTEITVQGRKIPEWQADSELVVGLLPQSPVQSQQPTENLTLIPMGSARLRITAFPSIAQ